MLKTSAVAMAAALLWAAPATLAAELSPWMGSQDQIPFQLDPVTMVAVTFAADPLQTGTTSRQGCGPKDCVIAAKPAMENLEAGSAPQN